MIFLWILIALSVITVGVGYRVSTALKLNQAKKYSLKAHYLANAGVNLAITEIKKISATTNADTLIDKWADNESLFKKIVLNDNPDDFAVVISREGKYGVIDEEGKININTASEALLTALLQEFHVVSPKVVADNILIWRGDLPDTDSIYEGLGYPCKGKKLSNIEELKLVKGINDEDYQKMQDLITVVGSGKLNINTVDLKVLTIFARGIALEPSINVNPGFGDTVAQNLIALRNSHGPFDLKGEPIAAPESTSAEELSIYGELLSNIVSRSDNFLIEVTGSSGRIQSKISAIYNRENDKIIYWHEG